MPYLTTKNLSLRNTDRFEAEDDDLHASRAMREDPRGIRTDLLLVIWRAPENQKKYSPIAAVFCFSLSH